MFDVQTLSEPVATKQKIAVRIAVKKALANGTFTYTDVLMASEPVRTMALEAIDGIESPNGTPQAIGNPEDVGPVRIVCINAKHEIKVSQWGNRNIFGTEVEAPREKISRTLGSDAIVIDAYPERLARNVLRRLGWPIRNLQSRGTNEGSVVEFKWLEREAKKPGSPAEIVAIYEDIMTRQPASEAPAQPIKNKTAGHAPAHP